MKIAVIISPNWRSYASKYLEACLFSLKGELTGETKVFLIDNESTAETEKYLRTQATEILPVGSWELITSAVNSGFAGGNNLALKKALAKNFDYAILFNMDGRVGEGCIKDLVATVQTDQTFGAVQARIMLWPDTTLINSLGNVTHFLGFGYCLNYREAWPVKQKVSRGMAYPSGAAVLLNLEALKKVGLFDETIWMYNEDQDLGWRLWLAGFKVVLCETAVFYHEYEFSRSITKYYWMDRNRLLAIFKNYHWLTLILILPPLLGLELVSPLLAYRGGWLKEKLRVWAYFCKLSTWKYLVKARKESQALRQVSDQSIVKLFSGRIDYQETASSLTTFGNFFLDAYWQIIRKIIFW